MLRFLLRKLLGAERAEEAAGYESTRKRGRRPGLSLSQAGGSRPDGRELERLTRGARLRSTVGRRRGARAKLKAVSTTLLIVGTFTASWLPCCVWFMTVCRRGCLLNPELGDLPFRTNLCVNSLVNGFVMLKLALNPLIYGYRISEIRFALRRMWALIVRRQPGGSAVPAYKRSLCSINSGTAFLLPGAPSAIRHCRSASASAAPSSLTLHHLDEATVRKASVGVKLSAASDSSGLSRKKSSRTSFGPPSPSSPAPPRLAQQPKPILKPLRGSQKRRFVFDVAQVENEGLI